MTRSSDNGRNDDKPMSKAYWVALFIALAILAMVILIALADRIPPGALTRTRMDITQQRILAYVAAHRRLPASLLELPKVQGRDSEISDGWGRPIRYAVNGRTVTLSSLGKDGLPGGTGENSDVDLTFAVPEASSLPATQQ